jgi:two-component system, LytTR family, response regulator
LILSCIIVEDEPFAANLLEEYIAALPYLKLEAKLFTAIDVLEHFQKHSPDLVFMDINLPKVSGIELVRLLPSHQKVIFTTAYADYALESYSFNTVDYLLKPISLDRFLKAVEKARNISGEQYSIKPSNGDKYFFIKSGKAIIKVSFQKIVLIEGLKDYVLFHLENEKHIVYKKMKELEQSLPNYFKRIHHSFIVNTQHLEKIEDNHVHLSNKMIPIGEKYRTSFLSYIKGQLM